MDEEQPGPPLIHIMTSSDREVFNSVCLTVVKQMDDGPLAGSRLLSKK